MKRTDKAIIAYAVLAVIVIAGAVTWSLTRADNKAIGTAATLAPKTATTAPQHGPKGEPCTKILSIPGKSDHIPVIVTRTVKNGVIYTQTLNGTWTWKLGTKPVEATEHVCAYKPAA